MIGLSTDTWATIGVLMGVMVTILVAMSAMFHRLRTELKADLRDTAMRLDAAIQRIDDRTYELTGRLPRQRTIDLPPFS